MSEQKIGYDAAEYSRAKLHAWRLWIERYTLTWYFQELGINFTGITVGDFGSGTGLYSRMMIDLGAVYARAIDGDRKMTEQAMLESVLYREMIEFETAWIQDTQGKGDCQVALGTYLLNYARTLEELTAYCRAIASHLTDDGIFIAFSNNPHERHSGVDLSKFGFRKVHFADTDGDSDGARIHVLIDGLSDPIVAYNLFPASYVEAFRRAGLTLHWGGVKLHPSQASHQEHWSEFFDEPPPYVMILATKGECCYDLSRVV